MPFLRLGRIFTDNIFFYRIVACRFLPRRFLGICFGNRDKDRGHEDRSFEGGRRCRQGRAIISQPGGRCLRSVPSVRKQDGVGARYILLLECRCCRGLMIFPVGTSIARVVAVHIRFPSFGHRRHLFVNADQIFFIRCRPRERFGIVGVKADLRGIRICRRFFGQRGNLGIFHAYLFSTLR